MNDQDFKKAKILIVDDQEISIKLLQDILQKDNFVNITSTQDPRAAKELYKNVQPDVVILDMTMPYLDGFQVMNQFQDAEGDKYIPVIIISNEENSEIRLLALECGARDFISKPFDRAEVLMRIRNIIEVRMLHNQVRNHNKLLEAKVRERTHELSATQLDVIQRLARSVEYRDSETGMHIIRMSYYAACLANEIGLPLEERELILTASPLHDIGKIGIPDNILRKPGKLTKEEWEIMKTHTTIGGELLSGGTSKFLQIGRQIALSHHEKWDGSGYPLGLSKEQIPLNGRICGLSDVFDALTTKRPYKEAWTMDQTLEEIKLGREKHFDPDVVDSFFRILPQIEQIKEKYADHVSQTSV